MCKHEKTTGIKTTTGIMSFCTSCFQGIAFKEIERKPVAAPAERIDPKIIAREVLKAPKSEWHKSFAESVLKYEDFKLTEKRQEILDGMQTAYKITSLTADVPF